MSLLKENEEKRSRKEEREKQQQQHQQQQQRARDGLKIDMLSSQALDRGMTHKDLVDAARVIGMSAREVNAWLKYMDSVGWAFSNGAPVTWRNYRRPLRMWHLTERRMRIERNCADSTTEEASAKKLEELRSAAAKPESWALCRERCAFAEACGCAKKHTIPPQLRPRPIPPEECADFAARVKGGAQ